MRGISLPIETIVIVAITVLVLTVIAVFFIAGAGEQTLRINDQQAFGEGCTRLATVYFCADPVVDERADWTNIQILNYGNLEKACKALGHSTQDLCRQACRCP